MTNRPEKQDVLDRLRVAEADLADAAQGLVSVRANRNAMKRLVRETFKELRKQVRALP